MNIGPAIRYLRKQKGWTQSDLAEYAFTSKSNISSIENKNHGYSAALLSYLAAAFGCKVSYIFALAEQLSAEMNELSHSNDFSVDVLFSRLSEGVQTQLKGLMLELVKSEDGERLG